MGLFGSEVETVIEETVKKNQQSKPIFQGKYRKGLKLYSLDPESKIIEEVKVEVRKDFHLNTRKDLNSRTANINPKHIHVWALNLNNAQRKFRNLVKKMVLNKMIQDIKSVNG